jgi:hypothetical protein
MFDFRADVVCFILMRPVVHRDIRASLAQRDGNGAADAAVAAGDERNFPREVVQHALQYPRSLAALLRYARLRHHSPLCCSSFATSPVHPV